MDWHFSQRSRLERLIAAGRATLSFFALIAVWLDPSEPRRWEEVAYGILIAYALFSAVVALVVFRDRSPSRLLAPVSLGVDLLVAALIMSFTEGATSPFFVYFMFAMVGGTVRWQWKGTLWTVSLAILLFMASGLFAVQLGAPYFKLNRFIIRGTYLPVIGILLGYVGAYQARLQRELTRLAAWRRTAVGEIKDILPHALEHMATTLEAARGVLVWEEPEEPWVNIAVWSKDGFSWAKEAPARFQPFADADLAGLDWLTTHVDSKDAEILIRESGGTFARRHGPTLHPDLAHYLGATSTVALAFSSAGGDGMLLALDVKQLTVDKLILGEIVRQQVVHLIDQNFTAQQLREAAVIRERIRLARDLHDGVLQALAAAGLKLQTAKVSLRCNEEATAKISQVQALIAEGQKEIRSITRGLGPAGFQVTQSRVDLALEVSALAGRMFNEWDMAVDFMAEGDLAEAPGRTAQHVCRLAHEALVNAARHGRATKAELRLVHDGNLVRLAVTDNGTGFPFTGDYDLVALRGSYQGPRTLVDRVDAIGGELRVCSSPSGARIEISLPWLIEGA